MPSQRDAAYGVLTQLRLEDGRTWGETAADYQRRHALSILDGDSEVRQHWLTLPRGGRKTTDLAGILLAVLATQAPPLARCYVGASDEDQARELIDAAAGLVMRTDAIRPMFQTGELTITNRVSGATVTALPADASAMGKRAFMIILDEVANWPDTRRAQRFWGVLTSGSRKLRECRLVVITNAGTPEHWAARRRATALKSSHWRVFEVDGPLPWLTPDDIAVLRENAETPSEFERLHLNHWVSAEDRLASLDDIVACTRLPESPRTMPVSRVEGAAYVMGVDMATTRDNAVVTVAHLDGADQRRVVVDDCRVWTPSPGRPVVHQEVEDHVLTTARQYGAVVVFDPAEFRGAAQRLDLAGVAVEPFTFTQASVGKLALTLLNLLRGREIALPDDQDLVDELAQVRLLHPGPGLWRIDHDPGRHDDRAIALALAAQRLLDGVGGPEFPLLPAVSDRAASAGVSGWVGPGMYAPPSGDGSGPRGLLSAGEWPC
jgi:hypothetical protein